MKTTNKHLTVLFFDNKTYYTSRTKPNSTLYLTAKKLDFTLEENDILSHSLLGRIKHWSLIHLSNLGQIRDIFNELRKTSIFGERRDKNLAARHLISYAKEKNIILNKTWKQYLSKYAS